MAIPVRMLSTFGDTVWLDRCRARERGEVAVVDRSPESEQAEIWVDVSAYLVAFDRAGERGVQRRTAVAHELSERFGGGGSERAWAPRPG